MVIAGIPAEVRSTRIFVPMVDLFHVLLCVQWITHDRRRMACSHSPWSRQRHRQACTCLSGDMTGRDTLFLVRLLENVRPRCQWRRPPRARRAVYVSFRCLRTTCYMMRRCLWKTWSLFSTVTSLTTASAHTRGLSVHDAQAHSLGFILISLSTMCRTWLCAEQLSSANLTYRMVCLGNCGK